MMTLFAVLVAGNDYLATNFESTGKVLSEGIMWNIKALSVLDQKYCLGYNVL